MKKAIFLIAAWLFCLNAHAEKDLTKYALPIVGSFSKFEMSNGCLYPCIGRPWGMSYWSPQSSHNDNRWFYYYCDDVITGLRQTHSPCPWTGDYGAFLLMPTVGEKKFLEKDRQSWFSHKTEVALPHYYKVYLAEHDVTAEMAPTGRACVMQFTFPESDKSNVVIDAFKKNSMVKVVSRNRIEGYSTYSMHHDKDYMKVHQRFKNFFVIEFDKPFVDVSLWQGTDFSSATDMVEGERSGAVVTFKTKKGEKITARIASSYISPEQAELNLKREVNEKTLVQIREESEAIWNKHLNRFVVEDNAIDDLDNVRMFYTCLYRMLLYPREFFEYDANNNIVHRNPQTWEISRGRLYTDTGLWDTFRAMHPFLDIFYPSQSAFIMESMVNYFKGTGWLPEWVSPGHFPSMIGSSSTSVVTSAILNGVKNIDVATLWEATYKNAYNVHPTIESVGRAGIKEYDRLGYVPNDIGIKESASRTLEYAYADFCMMRLAEKLGKDKETIEFFRNRALNYRNLYYDKFTLMAGKNSKGEFRPNFSPITWGSDFTEGNSWHYTWSVFHDPVGLAKLMGGDEKFIAMMDSVFVEPPKFDHTVYKKVIHEMREMQVAGFGQYTHGNQPMQHFVYLYNWTSQPWKAQYWARRVMNELYRPTPDGYCGDEDTGQTSAWYALSAMGFYSTCPVTGELTIGSPLFKKMRIKLENGKELLLEAPDNSPENIYIDKITVNGKVWNKNFFPMSLLQEGGTIKYDMSSIPNKKRGSDPSAWPFSLSN